MQGRIVLITGANGGLGTAVTGCFLEAGATVIGVSRSVKQSDFDSPNFRAMPADVTIGENATKLADEVVSQFGKIDALVHVMGGFAAGPVHETDDATWARMRDLNLVSGFNIFRAVIPYMRKARYGRIVAIGSRAAHEQHAGIAAYSAFKVGLASLVKSVAAENAEAGITANIVLPGTMDTAANRIPGADTSKWIPPVEVAKLVLFLAGDQAGYINGAEIPVSGRDV